MQHKLVWWVAAFVATLIVGALLVGFRASPAPQPQRVSDLVARIDALEEQNRTQQATLDDLSKRVAALEESGAGSGAIVLDDKVTLPKKWVQGDSSDGIVRYHHDPQWELTSDEPGALDLLLDENTAIFLTWNLAPDLLEKINGDEEYLRFFEKDLAKSDDSLKTKIERTGIVKFDGSKFNGDKLMGEDGRYWEISVQSNAGYSSRMLSLFYPCAERSTCSIVYVRYDPDPTDDEPLGDFSHDDWLLINTFVHGIEILSAGKATVGADVYLRACPETSCKIVGRLFSGEIVDLAAVSEDGLWYQLKSGEWIAANLVDDAPSDLPVLQDNSDT